jgi:hypothetical protein
MGKPDSRAAQLPLGCPQVGHERNVGLAGALAGRNIYIHTIDKCCARHAVILEYMYREASAVTEKYS